jgi:uncharacterized protein (TIGR03067 family)
LNCLVARHNARIANRKTRGHSQSLKKRAIMKFHNRWVSLLTVLLASATLRAVDAGDRAKANQADLEKLQGRWKLVSLLVRGKEARGLAQLGFILDFKDDKLSLTNDSASVPALTRLLRLDANTTPKLLDFAETAKAFDEHKDVVECVYTLDGDRLSFCFNLDGEQPAKANRPAAVESKPDSSAALIKLERLR